MKRRRFLLLAAAAAALSVASQVASAEIYPSRPVSVIVPVPAGGQMDSIARIVTERMRRRLGQPMIVENVTGASGTIGVGRVARATADGYTLLYGAWATQVVNGAVYDLPYDLIHDFEAIALTSITPWLIAAKHAVPANDLRDFITWLKANPDKASAGTSGAGGPGHIGGVLFQKLSGTRFQFVPYRGMTPAMQDLISGQIDLMIADPASAIPQFRAGRIKVFAVTAKTRLAAVPEIPTVDEAGVSGYYLAPWPRNLGASRNAGRDHPTAQCSGRGCVSRSCGAAAARHSRLGHTSARAADAGGSARLPRGRNSEVVANHQGGKDQGGMKLVTAATNEGTC